MGATVLIERSEEFRSFEQSLSECRKGKGSVGVVQGGVATGKTALLHAFIERAEANDVLVLSATAAHEEQHVHLGVINQLLRRVSLSSRRDWLAELLDKPDSGIEATADETARIVRDVGLAFLELADDRPMLIVVDDTQHADTLSLRCLLFVARRVASSRVLMLFGVHPDTSDGHDLQWFDTEVSRQPRFLRMKLSELTEHGVGVVLTSRFGAAAGELAATCHGMTGGNLLLVNGLLEDLENQRNQQGGGLEPGRLEPGSSFRDAVVSYLRRCDSATACVLEAAAVLDDLLSPELAGPLRDLDTGAVAEGLDRLEAAGLLDERRFRHPAIREAVLESLRPVERGRIHRHAATLLHNAGASAHIVARHLLAGGGPVEPWAWTVLEQAAAHELSKDRCEVAIRYLEWARQLGPPGPERAGVVSTLAAAQWRVDPGVATRHFPELTEALRAGHLHLRGGAALARYLLWHGQLDDAADVLSRLLESTPQDNGHTAGELSLLCQWLAIFYPTLLERVPKAKGALAARLPSVIAAAEPARRAGDALGAAVTDEVEAEIVDGARHILSTCRLSESTAEYLTTSLAALSYLDRLDLAMSKCDDLLNEATARNIPVWQAKFTAIRAGIAVRAGDLRKTIEQADLALSYVDPQLFGTKVGLPLACLVFAYTAMGKLAHAAAVLDRPIPAELFQSSMGLHYWRARGYHHLATGRWQAAGDDFRACGDLMVGWGLDRTCVVPWRTDLAWSCLAQGQHGRATYLAEEQLAMSPGRRSRPRGLALHILGAAAEPARRVELLAESVAVLERCGARLELAYVLADLSEAYRLSGNRERASSAERRARYLAKRCHAVLPFDAGTDRAPLSASSPDSTSRLPDPDAAECLSVAERRVAVLAAQGLTNREISSRLHVTVSTVEQHLTRAYRKLNVDRRSDLPTRL